MSIKQAQSIAVNFHGEFKSLPERKLGTHIEVMESKYGNLEANILEKCSNPKKRINDIEMKKHWGTEISASAVSFALVEYISGNADIALQALNILTTLSGSSNKCRAFSLKAFILADLGDVDSANKALSQAKFYRPSKYYDHYLEYYILKAEGSIAFAKGEINKAEKIYVKAIKGIKGEVWSAFEVGYLKMRIAKILILQGRLIEAEIIVNEALQSDVLGVVTPHSLITLSEIYLEQGRNKNALRVAKISLNYCLKTCIPSDSYLRAHARETIAKALIMLDRWEAALYQFNMIKEEMKTDPIMYEKRFAGSVDWGFTLLMNIKFQAAILQFEKALETNKNIFGNNHYNHFEIQTLKAIAISKSIQKNKGLQSLQKIIPDLIKHWQDKNENIMIGKIRGHRFGFIVESYVALLSDEPNMENAMEAFSLAEFAQSQSVGLAVAKSYARSSITDPELAKFIRQKEDLELKLVAHQNRLISTIKSIQENSPAGILDKLYNDIQQIKEAVGILNSEVKNKFPEYSAIINPDKISVEKVRSYLTNKEALIKFFVGQDHTFVWAFRKTGAIAFTRIDLGKKSLNNKIKQLRDYLDPQKVFQLDEYTNFNVKLGYELYKTLLQPVENGWKQAKSILLVPDGSLGQLPISILPTKPCNIVSDKVLLFMNHRNIPWLVRTHTITTLPSISAFNIMRSLPPISTKMKAFAGFGDPIFNTNQLITSEKNQEIEPTVITSRGITFRYRGIRLTSAGHLDGDTVYSSDISKLTHLPDTRQEIESIATALHANLDQDVFFGKLASEETVKNMNLSNRRIIVFATHALVPGDIDGLHQPAIALSAPSVTGGKGDGLLTMGEIMNLKLNADWVVLSACNTAAAKGAGSEAVSGLGQAFFYAGAKALLVTSWPVETTSAKVLTTSLFRLLEKNKSLGRSEALRLTQNSMIDKQTGENFSYAHPIFWAPFIVVGSGR